MNQIISFQIGKNGVTPAVAETLNNILKIHKHVRISVLKASGRNKNNMEELASELISKLEFACKYRIIGFTIVLRRVSGEKNITKIKK